MTTLLWHSNAPLTLTGYGLQTAIFTPRLKDLGYEITLSAPMSLSMAPLKWKGMTLLGNTGDALGNDNLPQRAAMHDLTITLCDLFGIFPCSPMLNGQKIAHWMPVDTDPMGERDIAALRASNGVPIAVSKFGYEMIRREGFDAIYVPHGVETDVFKPDAEAGLRVRMHMGIRPETFVIGMACVNKPDSRKGIDQQMQAFSIFHKKHPDSILFMHMPKRGGWEIEKIALQLGIHNAILFPDQHSLTSQMVDSETVAAWHNSLDLLSACSEAEGFGLPILETQSCGIPVVTTDYSSMTELNALGWTVGYQRHWTGGHESWWATPLVNEIADRYEEAFNQRENTDNRIKVRDFALGYDADLVTDNYWKPALDHIKEIYGVS